MKSVKELIALAKAKLGEGWFASSGGLGLRAALVRRNEEIARITRNPDLARCYIVRGHDHPQGEYAILDCCRAIARAGIEWRLPEVPSLACGGRLGWGRAILPPP